MSIRDWPSGERPREKLLDKGAGALSDAELLAVLLRTGTRGRSALAPLSAQIPQQYAQRTGSTLPTTGLNARRTVYQESVHDRRRECTQTLISSDRRNRSKTRKWCS